MSNQEEGYLHSKGNTQVHLHLQERKRLRFDDLKCRDADGFRDDGEGIEFVDDLASHTMIILRNQYISSWSDFRRWVHQVDDQEQLKEHPEGVEDLTGLVLQLLVGLGLVDLLRETAGLRDQTGAFHPGASLVWRVGRRRDPIVITGLVGKYRLFISLSPLYLFLEFRREEPGGSLELLALLHRADGLLSGKRLVFMRVHGHLGVSLLCHFDQGVS